MHRRYTTTNRHIAPQPGDPFTLFLSPKAVARLQGELPQRRRQNHGVRKIGNFRLKSFILETVRISAMKLVPHDLERTNSAV